MISPPLFFLRTVFAIFAISVSLDICRADLIVSDDFSGNAASNPLREPQLNETGITENNWKWSNEATYLENGAIISAITGQPAGGKVRIKPPTVTLEVKGSFEIATGITENSNVFTPVQWVAVALSGDVSESWTDSQNLVWAIVRPDGNWTLFQNGTSRVLADSSNSGLGPFAVGATTEISVQYNPENAMAALCIDGVNVSGWKQTTVDPAEIGAAGVLIFPEKETDPRAAKIENFNVSTVSLKESGD